MSIYVTYQDAEILCSDEVMGMGQQYREKFGAAGANPPVRSSQHSPDSLSRWQARLRSYYLGRTAAADSKKLLSHIDIKQEQHPNDSKR